MLAKNKFEKHGYNENYPPDVARFRINTNTQGEVINL